MCVGKKAAGKKNKFWVGRFSFIQFALEENLIFVTALGALHITLKGLVLRGLCAKYFQPRKTKPMLSGAEN